MANQRENAATAAASQKEQRPAGIEGEQDEHRVSQDSAAGCEQARNADVLRDEQEAMRRKELSLWSNEPAEAQDPQVAEIESLMAAVRH